MPIIRSVIRFIGDFILLIPVFLILAVLTELFTDPHLRTSISTGAFWLAIGLNMLPAIAVTLAVFTLAIRFLRPVYGLNRWGEGFDFLWRSRFGQFTFRPFIRISEGKSTASEDHILNRLGGPGSLIVCNDSAVVLEQGGQLTRVLGPGFYKLERFEKVYDIVDLRPKRYVYNVGAMTKEGISVNWEVEVLYQIADGGEAPTEKNPYPFSKDDVFRAATCKWRREQSRVQDMDWEGRVVIGDTEGILRSIVARRYLNQLIGLTEAEEQAARETIQAELTQELSQAVYPKLGAKILQVKLANLCIGDPATQELIRVWKAGWQSWSAVQWGQGQANRICEYERAKAEAQAWLIRNLAQGQPIERPVVLMRLFSTLDRANLSGVTRVFLPGQALNTWQQMDHLLNGAQDAGLDNRNDREQFTNGNGQPRPPAPLTPDATPDTQDDQGGPGHSEGQPQPPSPPANRESWSNDQAGPLSPEPTAPPTVSVRIPIVDEIAAGQEKPVTDDDIIGEIEQTGTGFRLNEDSLEVTLLKGSRIVFSQVYSYFAVLISGDSMDLANINPGDYVILQKSNRTPVRPESGDIVAVVYHDEAYGEKATLKRVKIEPNKVTLKPESSNPEHQPRVLPYKIFAGMNPAVSIAGIAIAVLKPQA